MNNQNTAQMDPIFTTTDELVARLDSMTIRSHSDFLNSQAERAEDRGGLWMVPETGAVDTKDNWAAEFDDLSGLIEVRFNRFTRDWEEV